MSVRRSPERDYATSAILISVLFGLLFLGCQLLSPSTPPPPEENSKEEISKEEVPKVEVPKVEVPKVEVPKVEVPKISQEDLAQLESALAVDSADGASESRKMAVPKNGNEIAATGEPEQSQVSFPLCLDKGVDFIPCLDNEKAIKALKGRKHYEHRERHCPAKGDPAFLDCLLPLPKGYKHHVPWPESRDSIWYDNVPHPALASYKADQNWVKAEGQKFVFPGGGTQFKYGATKYIEWLQDSVPNLTWGKHVRVALDMGCGVASFGAYLEPFETRIMSVAPKDEHEAQIQFALERGISALIGVMGTMRQPYPANVYDIVHCARCRVPWHREGGKLLLELNRLIRPGGYFVWSATPVCPECKASEPDDKEIWDAMTDLTPRMCWKMVAKVINMQLGIGVAVFQKPLDNECYDARPKDAAPPMCPEWDNANAAWYVPMEACLHRIPQGKAARGKSWPLESRERWTVAPAWLSQMERSKKGVSAVEEFDRDTAHWARVAKSYRTKIGVDWSTVRNVMDVDAHFGGFGAAIADLPMWSMNVVPVTSPDTLPVVFDRGLLGVYHDWCESFNTYPRTYDLVHCDHFLGEAVENNRCDLSTIMLEFDRILRPGGFAIIREHRSHIPMVRGIAEGGLHWRLKRNVTEQDEVLLSYEKDLWRPEA